MDDLNVTTPVEAEGQTGASAEGEGAGVTPQMTQQEAEAFFDATKVPAELQPSYREMQAAFTKKTQEVADFRRRVEAYGNPDEVFGFLDRFNSPDSVVQFWYELGQAFGLKPEQLNALFEASQKAPQQQAPGQQQGQNQDPGYMTKQEFEQYLYEQQQQQVQAKEDTEVTSALSALKLPNPKAERQVLALALEQPRHLGYTERINRAYADWKADRDAYAAEATKATANKNATAPKSLGGTSASGDEGAPKTLEEAYARSKDLMARLSQQ